MSANIPSVIYHQEQPTRKNVTDSIQGWEKPWGKSWVVELWKPDFHVVNCIFGFCSICGKWICGFSLEAYFFSLHLWCIWQILQFANKKKPPKQQKTKTVPSLISLLSRVCCCWQLPRMCQTVRALLSRQSCPAPALWVSIILACYLPKARFIN